MIELPGGVNDSSCHEKVDYSFSSRSGAGSARAIPTLCERTANRFQGTVSFTGGQSFHLSGGSATLGYAFTLSSPVLVTQLGLWDRFDDGLNTSHDVTIWTSTGTQEAQVTIPSGTGATLTNGFRYVSIPSVLLPAGSYVIGGFYSADSDSFIDSASITPASGVTYDGSRSSDGFVFPTGDIFGMQNSYFGPNFQFGPAGVPDTGSTLSLLGFASLGLVALRRKLRC